MTGSRVPRFVAYYRVSTERQGKSGLGLEAQRTAVANYLNGGKWELIEEFIEVESGKHNDRQELQKAFKHCQMTGATLVIAKLDRLSRDSHFIGSVMKSGIEFVACDMPAVSAGFLRSLLDDAERTGCECLVPVSPAGRIEPLCAVYRRTCLPELLRALDAGTRKMTDILEALKAVKRSVPESGFFSNLNTPEEWVTHEHSSGSESQGVHG